MPVEIPDLWPDVVSVSHVHTPRRILEHQVQQLNERTKGQLRAEVLSNHITDEGVDRIHHSFSIIAPLLQYEVALFEVDHAVGRVYPVRVFHESFGRVRLACDDDELLTCIRDILGSADVRSLILSLIARITEVTAEKSEPS